VTYLSTILLYGLLLSLAFTGLIFLQYALGSSRSIRDDEGRFKREKASPIGLLMSGSVIALFATGAVLANAALARGTGMLPTYGTAFLVSYGVFLFVNLWDLVAIDYLLLLRFRPAFVALPDTAYYTTFRPHLRGFFRGLALGVIFSLLAAWVTVLLV
jgi:hypothetical protein